MLTMNYYLCINLNVCIFFLQVIVHIGLYFNHKNFKQYLILKFIDFLVLLCK